MEEAKARSGLEALALRLTKRLAVEAAAAPNGENLIFSPLSIYAALSLVAAGARGRTLDEFLALLGAPSRDALREFVCGLAERALADQSPAGGPCVMFAYGLWHDKTTKLIPTYHAVAAESYKAEIRAVNFRTKPKKAVKRINKWAAGATKNLIDSILEPRMVPRHTDLILANAIYFKGKWDEPFDKKHTKDEKFYLLDGSAKKVPFMRSGKRQYIACHPGFKVLELHYQRGEGRSSESPSYSMCVFLPDARNGLAGLISDIVGAPGFLSKHRPRIKVTVGDFRLPKFKLAFYRSSIGGVLKDMGLKVAFKHGEADLSDMVEEDDAGRKMAIEKVIHKAVIEVSEEGTEAAAVTVIACGRGCANPKRHRPTLVDFVADHPFAFFVIEERSSAIMFAGHVLDPSKS